MLFFKTSLLTLIILLQTACVVTSPDIKKEGLFQYVGRGYHIVNSYPATNLSEATKIITLKTNYMRLLFEQTHEPTFGTPKWSEDCLKANKIGEAIAADEQIFNISELFVHFNGSLGHCEAGPKIFKAHHVLVYCPIYKEVIEYKFSYDPTLNFEKIDLCK